jgi:pimeloyl-ACP methyl ester carboxylesterase
VGESAGSAGGSKRQLAARVHDLVSALGLTGLTLVGHDVGGMIAYSYLRQYADAAQVVIMDTVIPGIDPWQEVLRNPHIWHFALHAIPALPETLVQGRQAEYFDFFYNVLSADPSRITPRARAEYVSAYRSDAALTAGFDFYRAFAQDARDNAESGKTAAADTPLLYLRGERESGNIATYAAGFRSAGRTADLQPVDRGLVVGRERPRYLVDDQAGDAVELLEFLSAWLESDHDSLAASLARLVGSTAYGPASLREDFARFRFLLGATDGEGLFTLGEP